MASPTGPSSRAQPNLLPQFSGQFYRAEPDLNEFEELDNRITKCQSFRALFNIVRMCTAQYSVQRLVAVLEEQSQHLVNASLVRVFVVNSSEGALWRRNETFSCDMGIVGHVVRTKDIISLFNPSEDSRYHPSIDSIDGEAPAAVTYVPIECDTTPNCDSPKKIVAVFQALRLASSPPFLAPGVHLPPNQQHPYLCSFNSSEIKVLYRLGEFTGNLLKNFLAQDRSQQLYTNSVASQKKSDALLDIAKTLASEKRLDSIVSIIVSQVPELLDADRCTLFFIEDGELVVTPGASQGRKRSLSSWMFGQCSAPPLPFQGKSEMRFPLNAGLAGAAASTGKTVNVQDASLDTRFSSHLDQLTSYRTRSVLCVPMIDSSGSVLGVVQAINKNQLYRDGFSKEDEFLLSTCAAQAAFAVRNCQMLERTLAARQRSDALLQVTKKLSQALHIPDLVRIIVSQCQMLLDSERCTVFILDREKNEMYTNDDSSFGPELPDSVNSPVDSVATTAVLAASGNGGTIADGPPATVGSPVPGASSAEQTRVIRLPIGKGLVGTVVTTGNTINIRDAYSDARFDQKSDQSSSSRTRALVCMPIKNHRDEVVGVVQVTNKRKHIVFNQNDEELLAAFSAQAAVAIENSRLFQQTERALNHALAEKRNLKFLLSFSKNLFSDMHLNSLIEQLTMTIHTLLKSDDCQLYLVDRSAGDQNPFYYLAKDESDAKNAKRYPLTKGIIGAVASTGKGIRISKEAYKDARYDPEVDQRSGWKRTASLMCCPINKDLPDGTVRVIGVIAIRDEKDRGGFGREEEKLLQVFSAQAAVAISNSNRFSEIMVETKEQQRESEAVDSLIRSMGMNLSGDNITQYQFSTDQLELHKPIGIGSYGEVHKATIRDKRRPKLDGRIVAVKRLYVKELKSEQVQAFCQEASLMCQLQHPNIVGFIGAVTEPSNLSIITAFCSRGSLANLLYDHSIPMDVNLKLKFALNAAEGMLYLHNSNPVILHRDLKTDNLLVDQDWTVKVADFGLTRFLSTRAMTRVGTPLWMAPEIIMGTTYTEKADIYAFGIILWEILARKQPYGDQEPFRILVEVVNNDMRPEITPQMRDNNSPLVSLIERCWDADAEVRPSFKQIVDKLKQIAVAEKRKAQVKGVFH